MYKAEQKAKKAKKNIAGIHNMQQTNQYEINVSKHNILTAHSSDESTYTDESLNIERHFLLCFKICATPASEINNIKNRGEI